MKKVLIISYYWPPAGGISVLRTLKFVKYLRNFGWEPIVYAPSNAHYLYYDEKNFKDIPDNVKIIRRKIIEPFSLFKVLTGRKKDDTSNPVYAKEKSHFLDNLFIWIRGNFFIPDARCMWIKPSVKYLSKYLQNNPVDAILTDGPPHTNTVIGMRLAQKFNIPFLADFQDPWTQVDYYKLFKLTKIADKKHKKLEQEVFYTAKKITIASPTWARELEAIGAKDVDVIYYGYDEDAFKDIKPKNDNNSFTIFHGGILGNDRNPEMFFKVLKDLLKDNSILQKKLKIKFAGTIDINVKNEIEKNGLKDYFVDLGTLPRHEVLQLMVDSNLLLLPINKADNAKGRLPGKLYEYLRSFTPVLALGPKGSDVEKILKETKTGILCEYDDYDCIYNFLKKILEEDINFLPQLEAIKSFDVKEQTKKIAGFLDEITKK